MTEPRTEARGTLRWTFLVDDYDAGTVFITDDQMGSQRCIAAGLGLSLATNIVAAHNAALAAYRAELAAAVGNRELLPSTVGRFEHDGADDFDTDLVPRAAVLRLIEGPDHAD